MTSRPDTRPADVPVSLVVVVGLLVGALLAAWWSVARTGDPEVGASGVTAASDGWSTRGWGVGADQVWQESIVRITTTRCGDEIRGSGVVIDGSVVTNRHVVDGAESVTITTSDGAARAANALTVGTDVDLARIEADDLPASLRLANSDPTADGAALTIAGFPGGQEMSSRNVAVVGSQRGLGFPDPRRPVRLDVEVVPGESGSPVVDNSARVVGLLYARADADGRGLAIGAGELRSDLRGLIDRPFERCG